MEDAVQMLIVFGSIASIILLPVYWRGQLRRRVLETVKQMADSGSPMSTDLVLTLMAPVPQPLPTRQRDIRLGVLLLALALGIVLIGLAAFTIAMNTGGGKEAVAIGAGVSAFGAIPVCIGVAFLVLGLGQKPEA
jgi:hypothetical protein